MEEDEIDKFLNNFEVTERKKEEDSTPLRDDHLQDYVTEKINQLAGLSIEAIRDVKDVAVASGDGETISALASLIAASTKQLELVSKFALQKEKAKNAEKMQDKDHAFKEKIVDKKHEHVKELGGGSGELPPMLQQNNIYVNATREEIMDKLLVDINTKIKDQRKTIDIEV